jgi:hypothetical protein
MDKQNKNFPYSVYKKHKAWNVILAEILSLVENKDITLQTHVDYIVGALLKSLDDSQHLSNGTSEQSRVSK